MNHTIRLMPGVYKFKLPYYGIVIQLVIIESMYAILRTSLVMVPPSKNKNHNFHSNHKFTKKQRGDYHIFRVSNSHNKFIVTERWLIEWTHGGKKLICIIWKSRLHRANIDYCSCKLNTESIRVHGDFKIVMTDTGTLN